MQTLRIKSYAYALLFVAFLLLLSVLLERIDI